MIFIMSIAVYALQIFTHSIDNGTLWLIVTMLFLINAGYGGGFSTLPVLLEQHFGMKSVSTVHGLALSAWAFAGLSGNQLASFVVSHATDAAHPIQRADSDHHRTVRRRSRVHHRRDARHERQGRQRLIITLSGMIHRSTR